MTFSEAIQTVLSKYATFSGRAARPEYWWWILFVFILMAVLQLLDGLFVGPLLGFGMFSHNAGSPLATIASLALFLPNLAVAVRRLHDIGRSGWWLLIGLIPLIGFLVLLYWMVQPSKTADNPYA